MGLSISVFGMGYVGSVSAACFTDLGHRVIGVDLSPPKVEAMAAGRTPIVEARMAELIEKGHRAGLLHATTNPEEAVCNSDISFVCVGTRACAVASSIWDTSSESFTRLATL